MCQRYKARGLQTLYDAPRSEHKLRISPYRECALKPGLPRVGSSTLYYLLNDHLGSTAVTADAVGGKVAELRYLPYGSNRYSSGATPTTYKFTGQRLDDSTGLYYYGARYYDPAMGRFIQADSIVPEPGNPQSLNRYSYVLNNPMRYTDPTGHMVADDSADGPTPPPDPYDLTYWLVMEMNQNAVSPEIMQIWVLNQLAAMNPGSLGANFKALAFYMFAQLVADEHRWDFKDRIERTLGKRIQLGSEWFEFSTPGNIHYGFVGTAAGFSRTELRIGAGAAQAWDDLRSDDPDATIGGLDTWFDASTDFYAVEFGVQLYKNYKTNVTVEKFNALLVSYTDRSKLAHTGPPQDVRPVSSGWPYAPGTFNGPVAPWPPFLFPQH